MQSRSILRINGVEERNGVLGGKLRVQMAG
jgi:hypothetical protein